MLGKSKFSKDNYFIGQTGCRRKGKWDMQEKQETPYLREFPMIPNAQMMGTSMFLRKYLMYVMFGFIFSKTRAPSVTFNDSSSETK